MKDSRSREAQYLLETVPMECTMSVLFNNKKIKQKIKTESVCHRSPSGQKVRAKAYGKGP